MADALVRARFHEQVSHYTALAGLTVYLYDMMLTINDEVRFNQYLLGSVAYSWLIVCVALEQGLIFCQRFISSGKLGLLYGIHCDSSPFRTDMFR